MIATDVIELMRGASGRVTTMRATIRVFADPQLAGEAWRRTAMGSQPGVAPKRGSLPSEAHTSTVRCWLAPGRAREETERGGVAVMRGDRWWRNDPGRGVRSNRDSPGRTTTVADVLRQWIDPGPLLPVLQLAPEGREPVAGRDALRVVATVFPDHAEDMVLQRLGWGAERYELLVDAERGVLLGTSALLNGRPFRSERAQEVAFDEHFGDDLFPPEPPAGEQP